MFGMPPNNSFNPTANSGAFIREACRFRSCVRGGLIRALGTPESSDPKQAEQHLLSARAAALWRSNTSLNPTAR
jgi:hypothetical protein